ncbi:MAG: hypothetical protein KA198_04360 [Chitinophagaceae bacterium]|nr:hypothetical protein [Chitinophagaceae bacterium]
MRLKLIFPIIFIFSGIAYYFLHQVSLTQEEYEQETVEESLKKQAWIQSMLSDPATGKIPISARSQELKFAEEFERIYGSQRTRGVSWNQRGPWNVGGRTRAFAMDVNNPNHLIAGAVSGGIWQSLDAGNSWTKVSKSDAHPGIVSITQDKRAGKTNIWYAQSGEITGTSASGGESFYLGDGAFRSIDNGNTWTSIASTSTGKPNAFSDAFQGGWRIAASPVDSVKACVYIAAYGSIIRSTDTGNTWTNVLGSINNNTYYSDVAVSKTGIVYAAFSSDGGPATGFFRSADGVHFTNITPSFLKSYDRTVLEINPNNENEVYFLSELPSDTSGGVTTTNYEGTKEYVSLVKYNYLSGDGTGTGGQWTNLSPNLPVNSPNQFDKFNCQGGYDLVVKCQPGSNTVIIGGTNLYRSKDGFTSPNQIKQIGGYGIATQLVNFTGYPNHHPDQHDLFFLPNNPEKLYSVCDGGVFFTEDVNAEEVVWQDKNRGYHTTQLYTVSIDESKPYDQWVLGGFQDNGNYITYSNNPTATWKMTVNGDGAYNYIAPNRAFYVISTQQGNVRKVLLDEYGNMMTRRRIDPAGYDKSLYNFINPIVVDPKDNRYLYMPIGKKIARLNNLNEIETINNNDKLTTGWDVTKDTIPTKKFDANSAEPEITALAIANNKANILYVGTNNRDLFRIDGANTGEMKFKKLDSALRIPAGGYISGIAIDPDSAKNILIAISNYNILSLFYSKDSGKSFFYVGGNLEGAANSTGVAPSVRCVNILVDNNGKRRYFAGTSIGLFSTDSLVLTTNTGLNKTVWTHESPELIGANVVVDIKIRQSDGYMAVATHGNGIFETYYTGNKAPNPTTEINANQIYPNPANSQIAYTFNASQDERIEAFIFDFQGRRLMKIVNGTYRAGKFTIFVNTSGLSCGHYFIANTGSMHDKTLVNRFVIAR